MDFQDEQYAILWGNKGDPYVLERDKIWFPYQACRIKCQDPVD